MTDGLLERMRRSGSPFNMMDQDAIEACIMNADASRMLATDTWNDKELAARDMLTAALFKIEQLERRIVELEGD